LVLKRGFLIVEEKVEVSINLEKFLFIGVKVKRRIVEYRVG